MSLVTTKQKWIIWDSNFTFLYHEMHYSHRMYQSNSSFDKYLMYGYCLGHCGQWYQYRILTEFLLLTADIYQHQPKLKMKVVILWLICKIISENDLWHNIKRTIIPGIIPIHFYSSDSGFFLISNEKNEITHFLKCPWSRILKVSLKRY